MRGVGGMERMVEDEGGVACRSLQELAPGLRPIGWLWKGWVPRGLLSLLGAAPGAGKSLVALDVARRVMAGGPLPDGSAVGYRDGGGEGAGGGAAVVYVDAESLPQVLLARATAWGIDLRRLFTVLPAGHGALDLGDGAQQERLRGMVARVRPELVIVDSLSSITRRGENNVEEVRAILAFLAAVASEQETAVLLIHHLRKVDRPRRARGRGQGDEVTAHDVRGSGHITSMARSVLALSTVQTAAEPDRNGPRRLEVIKSNLGMYPEALGVTLEADEAGAAVVRYGEAPAAWRPPTQVDECAAWLLGVVREAEGPVAPGWVVGEARKVGFKQWVVYRARAQLEGRIVDTGKKQSPQNRWRLAGE